jgi:hypothetical protein
MRHAALADFDCTTRTQIQEDPGEHAEKHRHAALAFLASFRALPRPSAQPGGNGRRRQQRAVNGGDGAGSGLATPAQVVSACAGRQCPLQKGA